MSISTIRMRDILALIAVVAILLAMIPTMVLAAGDDPSNNSDNTTITFDVQGSVPTISAVELYQADGTTVAPTMDPLTEYVIKVTVTDNNTLNALQWVRVTLYWDSNGIYSYGEQPTTSDNNTCAIMTWTNSGDAWTISPSAAGTTWSLLPVSCTHPLLTASSGDFVFHFKPGKVARENVAGAKWHICAETTADNGATVQNNAKQNVNMNWYGEIANVSDNATFSSVAVGCDNVTSGAIRATYISNGNFSEQVESTTSWIGPATLTLNTSGTPGNAQFSLMAANSSGPTPPGGAVQVSGSYQAIDNTGTYTAEGGHDVTQNTLWLSLGDTGIPQGLYTGYVWYQILH